MREYRRCCCICLPELPVHDMRQSNPIKSQSIQKLMFLKLLNKMMPAK